MAHRDNRIVMKHMQSNYRPKHFRVMKAMAWLIIFIIIMCAMAPFAK